MSRGGVQILGYKLTEAREARCLTISELADKIQKTRQSLSFYENGSACPSVEALDAICKELGFPKSFFTDQNVGGCIINGPIFFRSMASAVRKQRKQTEIWLRWAATLFDFYNQYVDFQEVTIPRYEINWRTLEMNDIEDIAQKVRIYWGLGNGPISNLTLLLENHGFIIVHNDFGKRELDAATCVIKGRPFVVINTAKATCSRVLMDLAHELGHLILHNAVSGDELLDKTSYRIIEDQAWRFASAFLMPEDAFACDAVDTRLSAFISLKRRWRVSIAAMIMRCGDLNIIDDYRKSYLFKELSRTKQRVHEPLDDYLQVEKPYTLLAADNLMLDEVGFSKKDLLSRSCLAEEDYRRLISAPDDYFAELRVPLTVKAPYLRLLQ